VFWSRCQLSHIQVRQIKPAYSWLLGALTVIYPHSYLLAYLIK